MRHQARYLTLAMSRCWLAAVGILCLSILVAYAQADRLEREVKAAAGREVRVGIYTNIRPGLYLGSVAGDPACCRAGTRRRERQTRCAQRDQSQTVPRHRSASLRRLLSRRGGLQRRGRVRAGNQPCGRPQAASALPGRCLQQARRRTWHLTARVRQSAFQCDIKTGKLMPARRS